jgi:hypothetical protein
MTSDERYAIDPEYHKWRDEEDQIKAEFFKYAYENRLGPTVLPLMRSEDW